MLTIVVYLAYPPELPHPILQLGIDNKGKYIYGRLLHAQNMPRGSMVLCHPRPLRLCRYILVRRLAAWT